MRRATLGVCLLGALLATTQASGQEPLPERVTVGGQPLTIGFELKTTDKGQGPNGRSTSHSLMGYVVPNLNRFQGSALHEAETWSEMSRAERTAFFFKHYAGGYTSNNFEVDTRAHPWADKAVSWYGEHLRIPHIEIRSAPFDNPREAMAKIHELRGAVSETIAYHMHVRFPDTGLADRAEAMTEYLRRASFAIWLRRADYSTKTDFVLKQADNQPMNPSEMKQALTRLGNSNSQGEIIGRRGLRVQRLRGPNGEALIDIEFRGLMKDTERLERYLRATAQAFSAEGQVGPWRFDSANPYRTVDQSIDHDFTRNSTWSGTSLNKLVEQMNAAIDRYGVEANLPVEERAPGIKALATAETESGKRTLLPSSFNWLFLPLEFDPALPERIQEQIAAKKRVYLRKLVALAERVQAGEFGQLGSAEYQSNKTGSRVRPILYEFINETYTDGNRTAKLFEWFETSVFNPQETVERTERWRQETGRNRVQEFAEARAGQAETEGFARARPRAESGPGRWNDTHVRGPEKVNELLELTRQGMLDRVAERILEAGSESERAELRAAQERLGRVQFELVETADVLAERQGETVRLSTGLLSELAGQAGQRVHWTSWGRTASHALMLIAGHELAHVTGIADERVADREGVRAVQKTSYGAAGFDAEAVRTAMGAFHRPTGVGHLDNLINRLKSFRAYGPTGSRTRAMIAAAEGQVDRLAQYRRADGTLRWKQVIANRALHEGVGLAHFGLALFLKELAVVGATGDKLRIEEFFDGLMTTDFYTHYGLFVMGARVGDAVYGRYLQQFVKPRFVQTIARNNFVLAAGLALPQIASGEFEGRTFVVSLGSLGLSATAMRAGLAQLEWVYEVQKARRVTQAATGAGRLASAMRAGARFGGWVYTAAELAVVLLAAEQIDHAVNGYLDEREARNALRDAGERLLAVSADPASSPAQVEEAAAAYHLAATNFRDFLYQPLMVEEVRFAQRLERAARDAKRADDTRQAMLENLEGNAALERFALGKHASLEAYAEHLTAEADARTAADVERYMQAFARDREQGLDDVYRGNRRADGERYLPEDADELFAQAVSTGNALQRQVARRAQSQLGDALRDASGNRLENYGDEHAFLSGLQQALREAGRDEAAAALDATIDLNARTAGLDLRLAEGQTVLDPQAGATDALEAIAAQGR